MESCMLDPRWVLPTISRPQNLGRLIDSYNEVEENAPVLVMLWADDPFFDQYLSLQLPKRWELVVEKDRFTATDAMRFLVKTNPNASAYGFLGDDLIFHTPWWETLSEYADDSCISYPDDGIHGPQLPTHFVCGRKLVETVGWWALPGLVHSGVDVAWHLIGLNIPGLIHYCDDVKFEHLHPIVNKGQDDQIYKFARSHLEADNKVFQEWHNGTGLRDAVMKVRSMINEQAA